LLIYARTVRRCLGRRWLRWWDGKGYGRSAPRQFAPFAPVAAASRAWADLVKTGNGTPVSWIGFAVFVWGSW